MSGMLLITWKNGRTVKTYGLNRLKIYNMKFTFICIVIVLSCSVCASGDVEIYPDLKFDLSSDEQRPRLESDEETSYYSENSYRRWPWEKSLFDTWDSRAKEFNLELPDQLKKFEQLLKHSQNQLQNEDDLPMYYNPQNFEDSYDEYKNLEKAVSFGHFPKSQILDDIKPYPHEDDFSFGDEDIVGEAMEVSSPHERQVHHVEHPHFKHVTSDTIEKSKEGQSEKKFMEDAAVVDDPSKFAYPPSDPRFFRNSENNDHQKIKSKLEKLTNNNIRLSHRSDEAISDVSRTEKGKNRLNGDLIDIVAVKPQVATNESTGVYIIAVVAGVSAAATVGLIAVGIGWYNLQKHVKSASDVEYPAYGVTGPNKDASPSSDRRLAQSAQMYHYQHQKQQIIAMESRAAVGERHGSVSEADSEEENEEGDYTVYECPGLAPTGEMEVKNPLFQDDPTPAQTPHVKSNEGEKK